MRHSRRWSSSSTGFRRAVRLCPAQHDEPQNRISRSPLSRVLRLALAVFMAAAGLTMVLVMVALVVMYGATPIRRESTSQSLRSNSGNSQAGQAAGTQRAGSAPRPSAVRTFAPGKTVALFAGRDSARSAAFSIPRPGNWGLRWRYACHPGQPGTFTVSETHTTMSGSVDVASSSSHGSGLIWLARDPGRHALLIDSNCSWRVRVVTPKSLGRRSARSGPTTRAARPRRAPLHVKIGSRVRLRFSSKNPSVLITASTPSQSLAASSPLGIGETTGPKIEAPFTDITGVPTS